MWDEAAKWLNKFNDVVVTGVDVDGYPVSIRVDSRDYDATTGTLAVTFPAALHPVEGQANLLAHSHDEKLWKLNMIQIKGRLESRGEGWVFQSIKFDAPTRLAFVQFLRTNSASAQKYLDKRGMQRPPVDWAAVKELQRRAKAR
ncbi:hypothetical protein ACGFK1_02380 [Mycobacterium sp. NPDC048908]|uniref:hypothetical protein n=1 Tax=Mycobacterium sp. NPDC048908 TaxID=3364292 RepID=UPI003713F0EE